MASRTSTSIGMGVTVTLLGVMLLATFILAIVFYGQKQRAERDLDAERRSAVDIIKVAERNADRVQGLLKAKPPNQSLVTYLDESLQAAMKAVTGSSSTTPDDLTKKLATVPGADTAPLLGVIAARDSEIGRLKQDMADADAARKAAQDDLQAQVDRLKTIEQGHAATINALKDQIGRNQAEVDKNRDMVQTTIAANNARVDDIRTNSAQLESTLRGRVSELEEKVIIQQGVIDQLRGEQRNDTLRPTDEYALVDARVIATEGAAGRAVLDIGRNKRVVLGMTFEVYSDAASIKPDAQGVYPRGKATLEVIRIDPTSSVCRIVTEKRGNPVVVGDVAANAIYDPNKTYSFVVFGNFDASRNGIATPQGRNDIVGLVSNWGGKVTDDISGNTDFLVLGEKPVLPPAPPPDAPIQVIQEYIRKQRDAQEYDRLFKTAIQTGIPVLNENRLYTLTGWQGSR